MAAKKKNEEKPEVEEVVKVEEVEDKPEESVTTAPQDVGDTEVKPDEGDEPATEESPEEPEETSAPDPEHTQDSQPDETADNPDTVEPMEQEHDTTHSHQAASASDFFGTPPEEKGPGFPKALLAVLLLVVVGGVAGFMFMRGGGQFLGANVTASPSPAMLEEISPSPSSEATPEAEDVDLSEYKVRVLNGTGTAGEAGKVKTLLEEAGFEEVATGNASSQDNEVTTVSAKTNVPPAAVKAVENALKGSFTVESDNELDEDSEYDIVVTTGGSSAEE